MVFHQQFNTFVICNAFMLDVLGVHYGLGSFVCVKIIPYLSVNKSLNFESREKIFHAVIRNNQTNASIKREFQKKSFLVSYCMEKQS